ncbi:hypothetical protein HDU76_013476 [Blyttiomyces sp. JEL0837]|nr:hypothetical protein HDU76_013476 [Blyttiomyces sp. JEL0837]
MALTVRFGDGREDLVIQLVNPELTIGEVKKMICTQLPDLASKHLRMISRGRILQDTVSISSLQEGSSTESNSGGPAPMYLHCAVSDAPASSESQAPQLRVPALGFDRLLEIGFSREEVDNLRVQFHAMRGTEYHDQNDAARSAEEDWIDNRNTNTRDTAVDGTHLDMLSGLIVGFFLGVLVLFWIKEQGLFTRRQQMGIIVGLLVNLSFGVLRMR